METTFSQVCLQMGVTGLQLLALMSNAQFPVATETGGVYSWSSGNSFAGSWAQALANGWKISTALMPTANIALTGSASTVPGPYRPRPVDPLFDDFA